MTLTAATLQQTECFKATPTAVPQLPSLWRDVLSRDLRIAKECKPHSHTHTRLRQPDDVTSQQNRICHTFLINVRNAKFGNSCTNLESSRIATPFQKTRLKHHCITTRTAEPSSRYILPCRLTCCWIVSLARKVIPAALWTYKEIEAVETQGHKVNNRHFLTQRRAGSRHRKTNWLTTLVAP